LRELNDEAKKYLRVHAQRFYYLWSLVHSLRKNISQRSIRICDVGPSFFTEILERSFPSDAILSLGFEHELSRGGHLPSSVQINEKNFLHFNLNDSQHREKWLSISPCDIFIMAEVLEHLYVAPSLVLKFLHSVLTTNGYLIIQTPNAASSLKRLRLLFGRNPYEMIRENAENPGHFREYTTRELCALGEQGGFRVVLAERKNYFRRTNVIEKIYGAMQSLVPPSLKDGITIVFQKI
jgi:predicted SAM-dependent methyltransferase